MICILVGLPARGKTYVAHKISLYLSWLGYTTRSFNVGNYRRSRFGAEVRHGFFDPSNSEALQMRKQAAEDAMGDMLSWWCRESIRVLQRQAASAGAVAKEEDVGHVAIYDATNSTKERRAWILRKILGAGVHLRQVVFIELICNDPSIIHSNILQVKMFSPDYVPRASGSDPESAIKDFQMRIQHYEKVYQAIEETEWNDLLEEFNLDRAAHFVSFIKVVNVGKRMILKNCREFWQSRIAYYLMNLHITPRAIYLCRHGESVLNVMGKIGGDSNLSENGWAFARALPRWIEEHFGCGNALTVWTSTLKRTIQTSLFLPYPKLSWKALDELYAGKCDGLSYQEIEDRYPDDFYARDLDKFHYRYPEGGESYADLVHRLEPIMMELERQTNILLIGHQAVLRAIYAYFMGLGRDDLPYVRIPLHTIIELRPKAYGCDVLQHQIGIPAVDTQREKPTHHP